MLTNGELERLIDQGITGITSNPSIFEKAILNSSDYDDSISELVDKGLNPDQIIEELMINDIQAACDLFKPIFEKTNGNDGFVSIEVDPRLANKTEETIEAANRIWIKVNRPNAMIKIPATLEGLPAVEESIANGININVTLIFSIERYKQVVQAYLNGLNRRNENNLDLSVINSVASVFVSRIDTIVDNEIVKMINSGKPKLTNLLGKTAVNNIRLLYQSFKEIFSSLEFIKLKEKGAKIQRPLWASTSTKNPNYNPLLYVDELFAKDTVNTLPPTTLELMLERSQIDTRIENKLGTAKNDFESLIQHKIDLDKLMYQLEIEGVRAFKDSYNNLRDSLMKKIDLVKVTSGPNP
jgi:transaldolase